MAALVAPRCLLTTDALGDLWANPIGTQITFQAALEVYRFLGAEDNIGLHFREGGHDQLAEDWRVLLDFADRCFAGEKDKTDYHRLPFPNLQKAFSWSAPGH